MNLLLASVDYSKEILITNTGHIFRFNVSDVNTVSDVLTKQINNDDIQSINEAVRNLVSNLEEIKYTSNLKKNFALAEEYVKILPDLTI